VIKRFINDTVAGSFTLLGLGFAVIVLPSGATQETMATLFGGLAVIWFLTGPLRWRDN
jgi:hypothetical protein